MYSTPDTFVIFLFRKDYRMRIQLFSQSMQHTLWMFVNIN